MSYTLKEYGSNIRKLVDYILTVEDRDERTQQAKTLIHLMKQLHPSNPNTQDPDNKFWDDLFIMSNFKLDVDAPYPMPEPEMLGRRPKKMYPNTHNIKYKHYGYNIELLIKKAIEIEDTTEKKDATIYICKLMKGFYTAWNKDSIEDTLILEHLDVMSQGLLTLNIDQVKEENLFGVTKDFKRTDNNVGNGNHYTTTQKPSAVANRREKDFNVASTRNDGSSAGIPLRRTGSSGRGMGANSGDAGRNSSMKRSFDKRRK
jgi:hypothetical protein